MKSKFTRVRRVSNKFNLIREQGQCDHEFTTAGLNFCTKWVPRADRPSLRPIVSTHNRPSTLYLPYFTSLRGSGCSAVVSLVTYQATLVQTVSVHLSSDNQAHPVLGPRARIKRNRRTLSTAVDSRLRKYRGFLLIALT